MVSPFLSDPQPDPQRLKRQLGGYVRRGNAEAAERTRRELKTAVLARHITDFITAAPLPTADQLSQLRALLVPDTPQRAASRDASTCSSVTDSKPADTPPPVVGAELPTHDAA